MSVEHEGFEVVEFAGVEQLRAWLTVVGTSQPGARHPGVWVRLRRARSRVPSITFHDLLVEGIAFGWSESTRHAYDDDSYLQRFAPRRTRGTASDRNRRIARELADAGRLTEAGRAALGM
jgi:uncharacterized protein YdeI (YjbR/CyaY-like superfamily)